MTMQPIIHSVFVGKPKQLTDARGTWTSSINRDPVDQPVQVDTSGLSGDQNAHQYHGGPDAAICVHLLDHYRFWNQQLGMELGPGLVGENLTLDQVTEDDICVGDIVRMGSTLAQISGPRVPCATLARRIGRADWVKLTIRESRTGFYMRVLEPGTLQAGDAWELQNRLNPQGTIPAINRCL